MGVGDNMSGIVWVMEWTSVLVIILHVFKKKTTTTTTKKHPNKTQENKRGRAAQQKDHSTK